MAETAKERIYREALEILRGMGINSKNRVMMPYGVAVTAQEFIEEKLEDAENIPVSTDRLSVEKLQEQLNTAKKALTEIDRSRRGMQFRRDRNPDVARQALREIGEPDEN
ncbi:hypothetical protein EFE21_09270 [Lactococcus lactis subsp. lactis]|uniref:hypothetical protein n=1 Tax=Lactococcus lactis TaxID=1358 RepID=UPI00223BDBAB|nr:hypothetical protein [Lactococcus lactis]MCT0032980.1 hypothetical protein [Lactococcus lactis subsp. lactis]